MSNPNLSLDVHLSTIIYMSEVKERPQTGEGEVHSNHILACCPFYVE